MIDFNLWFVKIWSRISDRINLLIYYSTGRCDISKKGSLGVQSDKDRAICDPSNISFKVKAFYVLRWDVSSQTM